MYAMLKYKSVGELEENKIRNYANYIENTGKAPIYFVQNIEKFSMGKIDIQKKCKSVIIIL